MKLEFECYPHIKMSPMEMVIYNKLKKLQIEFYQEVMFDGCRNPKTNCKLRYDFYIPSKNMLVEYDGKTTHLSKEVRKRDSTKNWFARSKGIKLIRLSGQQAINLFIDKYMSDSYRSKKNPIKIIKKKTVKDTIELEKQKFKERAIRKKLGIVLPKGMTEEEYRTKIAARNKTIENGNNKEEQVAER